MLKLSRVFVAGIAVICLASVAAAASPQCVNGVCEQCAPPILTPGRPSPPPCCADGMCHPNPMTFGWYETRWRRWPLESVTTGEGARPGALGTEIRPYETPSAEEEDQKVPLTAPPEQQMQGGGQRPMVQPQGAGQPQGNVQQPGTQGPGTMPVPPQDGGGSRGVVPPYQPQYPGNQPLNTTPSPGGQPGGAPASPRPPSTGIPTGDLDPPPALPALPVATRSIESRPKLAPPRNSAPAAPRQPAPEQEASPSSDPPPALPTTLANWAN